MGRFLPVNDFQMGYKKRRYGGEKKEKGTWFVSHSASLLQFLLSSFLMLLAFQKKARKIFRFIKIILIISNLLPINKGFFKIFIAF